ncbi:hypothetical protein EYZ11_006303 [Aspergillus tanneri]|uniref:N-acetyltransferase domain-containing protein n=1 Tax=Aspergillus tanneri TaxID=1220188 RepID=A0A4V3UP90_9EURO|nr:uncharacterized protein ATNIH1004_004793 [Aspergillus tanneri]KAA8648906.1 hypothetical protein ATNIH1004_004793 [Aspergillus tanneri]THC94204.1 hypothetical protein EYZ11_006303 [Aspergillus tanneri]
MVSIRAATAADLLQIQAINTHYILNTCLTFAQNHPPSTVHKARLSDLHNRGLPYLVATEANDNTKETVLGYTYLSPFRGHMLSYGSTVELSLFVHPDYHSRSIGSLLLSTVLECMQTPGIYHRAFEVTGDGEDQREIFARDEGGVRVNNIVAVMAVDPEGKDGGDALRRWYIKRGFVECGRLKNVGFKRGYWLDTIYFQYTLSE